MGSERKHAILSASGAKRWLNCRPSARLEEALPEESSTFAEEGTLAHELSEAYIRLKYGHISGAEFKEAHAKIALSKYYGEEMEEKILPYLDYVDNIFNAHKDAGRNPMIVVESRLDFSDAVPEGFGRGDILIFAAPILDVIDLKYGAGLRVVAAKNPQTRLYAWGALKIAELFGEVDEIYTHIVQPRLGGHSIERLTPAELEVWIRAEVIDAANEAFAGGGEMVPGTWCQFCKIRPKCRKMADEAEDLAAFAENKTAPGLISDAEFLEILARADHLSKYLNSLKDFAIAQALNGKVWEGFKVVSGTGKRYIFDEKGLKTRLRGMGHKLDEFSPRKFATLGALEKLVGKSAFALKAAPFMLMGTGKPTLVPEWDKRTSLVGPTAAEDFENKV
jgi:hypothetical protein